MTVKAILSRKGRDVVTIAPTANLSEAVKLLAEQRIGAVVVTGADDRVAGILSERDIVRALGERGADGARRQCRGGDDAQGHDLRRGRHDRGHHGADDDGQIPPSAGGGAGPARRRHLDRRRGEDRASRRSSASPTRCASTSRRRSARSRTSHSSREREARATPAPRSPRRALRARARPPRRRGDRLLRAVEIEQPDAADARADQDVGRIAGEPRARDAVLHDVERLDHHGRQAGPARGPEQAALGRFLAAEQSEQSAACDLFLDRRLRFRHRPRP